MSPGKREPRNLADVEPDSFGAQLRKLRVDAGLSQGELGAAVGADQARVSAWERNRYTPHEDIIIALAQALNVPPGKLYEGSRWGGVLPVPEELRDNLKRAHEQDWQNFSRYLESADNLTPEQRARFIEGFNKFLETWKDIDKN